MVTFIPAINFVQVAEPVWSMDGYGCDKASVKWRGPRTSLKAFQDALIRFSSMPASNTKYRLAAAGPYPTMYLVDWQAANETASFPSVTLDYLGFKNGIIPPPAKPIDSTSSQQVNGEGTDTATGDKVTGTIQYRASRTTWSWFMNSIPPSFPPPQYAIVNSPLDPFNNIESYRMQVQATGQQTNSIPYSSFVAIINSLARQTVVSNYEREPLVPGLLYACRSDVDFKLVH